MKWNDFKSYDNISGEWSDIHLQPTAGTEGGHISAPRQPALIRHKVLRLDHKSASNPLGNHLSATQAQISKTQASTKK